ncbi:DUF4440 domain-containing protein [Mycobacterium sp. 1245111.1]|uniref:nuclear transport factor 2 family protein n=1 Tax=Mycobacterium sp. 1245111.1 TaxID=1834073 RepID=UPI000800F64F|nr:nuclear transport factor 2 family protein [Mycobacterium sp. 1245111.1]OBK40768.1 DUF4440 domain-containing protein [Mycobacterium sp. 1245111.1]
MVDELEAIRQLKARYCRFLDAKDADGWRSVFSDDVVVLATMHHCHTPEITLTSPEIASGIWTMEDWIIFGNGNELHGAGHYHETYEKRDGSWRIKTLHLTRTIQQITGGNA